MVAIHTVCRHHLPLSCIIHSVILDPECYTQFLIAGCIRIMVALANYICETRSPEHPYLLYIRC